MTDNGIETLVCQHGVELVKCGDEELFSPSMIAEFFTAIFLFLL